MFKTSEVTFTDALRETLIMFSPAFILFVFFAIVFCITLIIHKVKYDEPIDKTVNDYDDFALTFSLMSSFILIFLIITIPLGLISKIDETKVDMNKTVTVKDRVESDSDNSWTFKEKGKTYHVDMSNTENKLNVKNGDKVHFEMDNYYMNDDTIDMSDRGVHYEKK